MTQPKQPPQTPQTQQQHKDRASALQQIDPAHHQHADALAAAGFNWTQIVAILQTILSVVGPLLKQQQPQAQRGQQKTP